LIVPGDRVDVLIGDGAATTVIENVEVLALGSGVVAAEAQGAATITVAVDPQQAQLLAEAMSSGGKIRLSRPA
jgi:Flp pilus assembly protein CpaB